MAVVLDHFQQDLADLVVLVEQVLAVKVEQDASANTGSGGGTGASNTSSIPYKNTGGSGGSGIVVIRYKFKKLICIYLNLKLIYKENIMAHFAKIGANSKVISVLTLDNKDMLNADGVEDEAVGQQYLELHNNWPAQMWIQTSYNTSRNEHSGGGTPLRGNYAGIGFIWDEDNNMFFPPKKPHASWLKDTTIAYWKSPLGDAPALTTEQENQNTGWEGTKRNYVWNRICISTYDNTAGWVAQ